ncbi:hypothetical protein PCCS19_26420 [Paenibacillus sp. CCS19]|nr:hypothetical protein PCCS19_26420 [Paenibacillus cellulosilyticus]
MNKISIKETVKRLKNQAGDGTFDSLPVIKLLIIIPIELIDMINKIPKYHCLTKYET